MPSFTLQGYLNFINTASPIIIRTTTATARGIQKGLNTQSHGQVITPHNFITINATRRSDNTPGP